jgi:hypothetical protein
MAKLRNWFISLVVHLFISGRFVSPDKENALGMGADTGLWLMPVQYEQTARAAGNAIIVL